MPALIFTLLNAWWAVRCPPGMAYLGYLQGDQPAYTALARAVFQRGNGLVYANPFDFDPGAPRVLSNLGYVALGWLIRLTGGRTVLAWEVWRLGFGVLCFGLFAALVARLFASNGMRWWVFVAGTFGGGAAWAVALSLMASHAQLGLLPAFLEAEEDYAWWCLNLFRQSLYPLELAYHALFFAALLCWLDGRRVLLLAVLFLLWWTHTITAILATTVVGLALGSDYLRERRRGDLAALIGLACVTAPWVIYYCVYLPQFPSIRSWIEQTLSFEFPLRLRVWPRAWGVLLLALPAALVYRRLRDYLLTDRAGRLVLFWGIAAFAWAHNNLFLPRAIQPVHFARGYVFLFLLIVAAKGVELALASDVGCRVSGIGSGDLGLGSGERKGWWRRPLVWGAIAAALVLAADNVLFVARVGREVPQPGLLTISREANEVLGCFRAQPGSLGVLSVDRKLGVLIVAGTRHRVFASEAVLTPFFTERSYEAAEMLAARGVDRARTRGVDHVVLWKVQGMPWPAWCRDPKQFKLLLENDQYVAGELEGAAGGEM